MGYWVVDESFVADVAYVCRGFAFLALDGEVPGVIPPFSLLLITSRAAQMFSLSDATGFVRKIGLVCWGADDCLLDGLELVRIAGVSFLVTVLAAFFFFLEVVAAVDVLEVLAC